MEGVELHILDRVTRSGNCLRVIWENITRFKIGLSYTTENNRKY